MARRDGRLDPVARTGALLIRERLSTIHRLRQTGTRASPPEERAACKRTTIPGRRSAGSPNGQCPLRRLRIPVGPKFSPPAEASANRLSIVEIRAPLYRHDGLP